VNSSTYESRLLIHLNHRDAFFKAESAARAGAGGAGCCCFAPLFFLFTICSCVTAVLYVCHYCTVLLVPLLVLGLGGGSKAAERRSKHDFEMKSINRCIAPSLHARITLTTIALEGT
jgi:hypothetical protein